MRVIELEDLDHIREAIVILKGLEVESANKPAEKLGFKKGKNLMSIFTCKEMDRFIREVQERKNFSLETNAYFFELHSKRFVSFRFLSKKNLLFVNDLTEERNLSEAKLDFVTAISHELFTPLSASKANVFLLKDLEDDPEKLKILGKVERSLDRMETIIRQLKVLTMIQLGLYELKMEHISVEEIVHRVLEELREKIEPKKIKVNVFVDVETIESDRFVFYTILKNLVSNAVKYSYPESVVEISVTGERLSVKDQGIGIKEEEKSRIFERFYRGSEALKMAPGSGLGLSIVKHLCDTIGYRLEVNSQWLIGSEFIVYFK
jgi:two-component system OmpR family sensor kinase